MVTPPPNNSGQPPGSPSGPDSNPPVQGTPQQPTSSTGSPHYGAGGQIQGKPMKFLGMDFTAKETQQLYNILVQTIATQIQNYTDKGIKGIKKMGKSTSDDTDDDD
jgi:hypothetical protein